MNKFLPSPNHYSWWIIPNSFSSPRKTHQTKLKQVVNANPDVSQKQQMARFWQSYNFDWKPCYKQIYQTSVAWSCTPEFKVREKHKKKQFLQSFPPRVWNVIQKKKSPLKSPAPTLPHLARSSIRINNIVEGTILLFTSSRASTELSLDCILATKHSQ